MLTENNLRCFVSLAETLSFTRTAKRLNITQQAVSHHIARLEDYLGFPLFIRTHASVSLTKGGRQMFEFWSQTLQQFSLLWENCRSSYSTHQGYLQGCFVYPDSLHVGYQSWINFGTAVNTALCRLEAAHPDSIVESIRSSPDILLQHLNSKKLDLILICERFVRDLHGVSWVELLRSPVMLMVSPLLSNAGPGAAYQDFTAEPFIFDAFPSEPPADALLRAKETAARFGLSPSKIILSSSNETAYTEAELGRGYILSTGVSHMPNTGSLLRFPVGEEERILCLWNDGESNPLAKEYVQHLKTSCHGDSISPPSRS